MSSYNCNGGASNAIKAALFLLCISQLYTRGVDGLRCFTCMSMDCQSEEKHDCLRLDALLQSVMRNFYFIGKVTAPCPPLNELDSWGLLQNDNDSLCPEPEASCAVGRIQLKTVDLDENENVTGTHYSYATVLGCANPNVNQRAIKASYQKVGTTVCDNLHRNQTFCEAGRSIRMVEMMHCRDPTTDSCNDTDFCVEAKESVVKPLLMQQEHGRVSNIYLFLVIMVLLGIGVGIVMVGVLCLKKPAMHAGRLSTLPTSDFVADVEK